MHAKNAFDKTKIYGREETYRNTYDEAVLRSEG